MQNISLNNDHISRLYYSTHEISKELLLSDSCIRFWTDTFGINIAFRSGRGGKERHFAKKEVALFFHIKRLLKEEKYTIEGAKIQLRKAKLI